LLLLLIFLFYAVKQKNSNLTKNALHFFVLHLKQKKVSIFCQCFKIQTKKVNKKSKTTIENTETKILFLSSFVLRIQRTTKNTETKILFETLTKNGNLFLFQILFETKKAIDLTKKAIDKNLIFVKLFLFQILFLLRFFC